MAKFQHDMPPPRAGYNSNDVPHTKRHERILNKKPQKFFGFWGFL